MGTSLEPSYQWRTPAVVTTVAMLFCVALLIRNQPAGWISAAALVVVLWLLAVVVLWRRTQALMIIDGSVLTVRTFRRLHRIDGPQVLAVKESMTPSGASYRLLIRAADGTQRRQVVPADRLRKGHSTLFTWILTWAPQAALDRGSRRTLENLQDRGLVGRAVSAAPSPMPPPEEERVHRG